MHRHRPRPMGVSLNKRAAGLHRYRDESRADGGKKYLRRAVRAAGKAALRRAVTAVLGVEP